MIRNRILTIDFSSSHESLKLIISSKKDNTLYFIDDALENCESPYQLIEGCFYDYEFSKPNYYFQKNQITSPHSLKNHIGIISTNSYVGTLILPIYRDEIEVRKIELEVQSLKTNYREDYREMLAQITQKCTDLIMQANSPTVHYFEINYESDNETLYQKFEFVKSIINTESFAQALQRIISSPVTKWTEKQDYVDLRKVRKLSNSNFREIIKSQQRIQIPKQHVLNTYGVSSIPKGITSARKLETTNTPENRFIKHAIEEFLKFCQTINQRANSNSKLFQESFVVINNLETYLAHSFFKDISRPTILRLNSPSLQKKEGYREVFQSWLIFDLAAKLIWKGGDDIYSAGKKNVAVLYEYWLFFIILEILQELIDIEQGDISALLQQTKDGLNLNIKQGESTALFGTYNKGNQSLNVKYIYNQSFSGSTKYPDPGSWSVAMRPDYTLSFWPSSINEHEAEEQELIYHIHFDAKYKLSDLNELLNVKFKNENNEVKEMNWYGIYKNTDILKMHAYKDAIRRTVGAYVLYPGDKIIKFREFHESIPGIGAFPVKPSKMNNGIVELKQFLFNAIEIISDCYIDRKTDL